MSLPVLVAALDFRQKDKNVSQISFGRQTTPIPCARARELLPGVITPLLSYKNQYRPQHMEDETIEVEIFFQAL